MKNNDFNVTDYIKILLPSIHLIVWISYPALKLPGLWAQ